MQFRKVLLIAYHFPPIQGSTGTIRTVSFAKYLRRFGWDVQVLTIRPEAYEDVNQDNAELIPSHVSVHRAWGFDARRSLGVLGRYPLALAIPDRWQSWIMGGVLKGRQVIRSFSPDILMTSYPIPSAHVIGYLLQRYCGVPWVAEFRDPMLQANYPTHPWERRAFEKIENLVVSSAKRIIVTTEGCRQMYLDRYPSLRPSSILSISNGYDPEAFENIQSHSAHTRDPHRLVLLHSGLLYPNARNPQSFFEAICALKDRGLFQQFKVEFRFRASGHELEYKRQIQELGIESEVRILPRLSYAAALQEMAAVDALLVFQAQNCNQQIPAKVYEYMRCQKPILALTDPEGETGQLLRSVGVQSIALLEAKDEIQRAVEQFIEQLSSGTAFVVSESDAARFSRESLTADLDRALREAITNSA